MQAHGLFNQFITNKLIYTAFFGWLIAQTIKVAIGVIQEKRFNFKWFIGTGGMPSSHTSGVTALTTAVGLYEGIHTPLFAVTIMFAIIVICDAQGVRRSTGQQAEILNTIMDDIYFKKKIQEEKLIELVGHTPFQVVIGLIVGLGTAFLIYYINGG